MHGRLVGRRRELDLLAAALAAAQRSSGGLVVLSGEAGIGKTSVATAVADTARSTGWQVGWGRCREDGLAPTFWPWLQILRSIDLATTRPTLPPSVLDDLDRLLEPTAEAAASASDTASARFRLLDSIARALVAAADGTPLLVIVDDLHRADAPSIDALRHVLAEVDHRRVLLVATLRDREVPSDGAVAALLADLPSHTTRLHLEGLDEHAVADLLVDAAAPEGLAARIRERTNGNPLFVCEVVRYLAGNLVLGDVIPVPPTVRETIRRRVGRLSPATSAVVELAAVVGREIDVAVLADALGQDVASAIAALEAAEFVARVPESAGRFRFVHALTQEAIVDGLAAGTRAALHGRVLDALARRVEREGPAGDQPIADLVHHAVQAEAGGVPAAVGHWAGLAGRRAMQQYAHEQAAEFFALAVSRAAPGAERAALLLELGAALRAAGRGAEARTRFEEAVALARRLDDAPLLVRAALGVGTTVVTAGSVDHALIALLEEALAVAPTADRVPILARLAIEHYWSERGERSRELSALALAEAEAGDDRTALGGALFARLFTLRSPTPPNERLAIGRRLVDLALAARSADLEHQARTWTAAEVLQLGDLDGYRAELARLDELAAASRQPAHRWYTDLHHGCLAILEGRTADAVALAERAAALGRTIGAPVAVAYRMGQLAPVLRDVGGVEALIPQFREVYARIPYFATMRAMLSLYLAEAGERDEAAEHVRRLVAHEAAAMPPDSLWIASIAMVTEAAAVLGDVESAAVLYDLLRPHAGRIGVQGIPSCVGSVDRHLGRAAATIGDIDGAHAHFDTAERLHRVLGARTFLARTVLDRARLCRDTGAPLDRAAIDAAARDARALGAMRLADELDAYLPSTPTGPAGPATSVGSAAPGPLSPREQEVLRLVASGRSNKDTAETLFVSVHTVERHLANIYAKLGVRGRTEAAAWAHHHGLG